MHLDVHDLRNFYYRTRLGRAAQKAVRDQMLRFWPRAEGETVAGFGFAVPLMRPYLDHARRVVVLMPGPQGVMRWPPGRPNVVTLCEETLWPLRDEQADKLVVMHGLEVSENAAGVLGEAYRVLKPEGRALFIVPNRAGLWSRNDLTPFGFGRPFSLGQLEAQIASHDFKPCNHAAALFQPPSERPFWMRAGGLLERAGRNITGRFAGGVLMVEATKQVPARFNGSRVSARRPLRMLEGIGAPAPGRARDSAPGPSQSRP
ncbi:methyltransferase domain-containing protein [Palleronia sediminis]|uniref:Methyltransferase domain-containing protein n=1 Tax=Palleronia sediminis TaxID=2547833 RepID=A0A4R6AJF0_9RHOB|nr:methyltransferase domain-containing protein [Palleronia sediminis]TDL81856.1 methyltransferase domain-containing protein [Palleronia sediminis]